MTKFTFISRDQWAMIGYIARVYFPATRKSNELKEIVKNGRRELRVHKIRKKGRRAHKLFKKDHRALRPATTNQNQ